MEKNFSPHNYFRGLGVLQGFTGVCTPCANRKEDNSSHLALTESGAECNES